MARSGERMIPTPTKVGDVIAGKYRVERLLGRGGMGVVVVARHLRLGERVAIKIPVARLAEREDIVGRWVREGRAAMRIRSQHVARVFDVGVLDTGEPYLVMEYLVGKDLGAVLSERGRLPVEEAVEHILHATEALAEAHCQRIIHRDLKPSNLFVTRAADGSSLTKVLDFGTAKTASVDIEHPQTSAFAVVGTPLFMAPEQMRANQPLDVRADIWGLGATLHALMTGKPPFSGGSMVEIYDAIVRGAPPLRSSQPDASPDLEKVLLRCMQTDRNGRYASVADLADALAPFAAQPVRHYAVRVARILQAEPIPPDSGETGLAAASGSLAPALQRTESTAKASWFDAERKPRRPFRYRLLMALAATAAVAAIVATARRPRPSLPLPDGETSSIPDSAAISIPTMTHVPIAWSAPSGSASVPLANAGDGDHSRAEAPPPNRPSMRTPPRLVVPHIVANLVPSAIPDASAPTSPPTRPNASDPLADPN